MARASADVKKGNATYVYCVVAAPKRPPLTGAPAGLPGTGPVRLLDIDAGRHIVVTDALLPGSPERLLGLLTSRFLAQCAAFWPVHPDCSSPP